MVVDLDAAKAAEAAKKAGNNSIGVGCDITNPAAVRAAFDAAVAAYGGVDIVVSNAGAAWEGAIGDIDDALLRKSFELNFFAHQSVAQNAVRIFKQQGTGGVLLFNASKQAVNPGAEIRRLRPAEGGDAVPVAPIRAGIRRGRHPLQRGQRRPHPLRPADRRDDRQPLDGARACRRRTTCPAICSARK